MDDLISRKAVLAKVVGGGEFAFIPVEKIREIPSVDAVQVVRCGVCEHWHNVWGDRMKCCRVPGSRYYTEADWYCPKGKRKEEYHAAEHS